ncbi:uncharacterized protein LOC126970105 [Leptidea sinapis]|uniref:uncharacterized protein LOC126970105 n=1 Tax=Leptidea sinapis TaxID=189913 RepID=UPI0021C39E8B|nr:uncharacterized protein LOC126970105 [Leptidea sinapis]
MASIPNSSPSNGPLGKRKKTKSSKRSYLSKWLDKTTSLIQEPTQSFDSAYDIHPNFNWPMYSEFHPGHDRYRYMYSSNQPTSLPSMPTYPMHRYPEYSIIPNVNNGIQRTHIRRRRNKTEVALSPQDDGSCQSYLQPKIPIDSQDYASLPPIITADTNCNSEVNLNDKDDSNGGRRYSDPCPRGLPDVADHRPSNEVESETESGSETSGSQVGSRLLSYLLDQISSLKLVNERLSKELRDTRAELESIQQPFYPKSASSLGGSGVHNGQYSPGFLTELVREIRDATRTREEAMYTRLRAMMLEKTEGGITSAETKLTGTLEEIKNSLRSSETERRRMAERITKLEDELKSLRIATSASAETNEHRLTNGQGEEADSVRLRKEVVEMRRAKQSAEENAHMTETKTVRLEPTYSDRPTYCRQ